MEYLENAKKNIKRIDHSVYVSLKYTRTVDVLKTILDKMVLVFDDVITNLLKFAIEEKKIDEFPKNIPLKCKLMKETYVDEEYTTELFEFIDFFIFLRKVDRAQEYTKIKEYRRHVALITEINGERVEINLDIINEYFEKTKRFINLADEIIYGIEDD